KGSGADKASIELTVGASSFWDSPVEEQLEQLRYTISFGQNKQQFEILYESIAQASMGLPFHTEYENFSKMDSLIQLGYDKTQPILAQPQYFNSEVLKLARNLSKTSIYRDWIFGRNAPIRKPQIMDLPSDYLEPSCENLCLVLNQIGEDAIAKKRLLKELQTFYDGVEDYEIKAYDNYMHLFFYEKGLSSPVSATRLSDGTLRYLCLLAILCNPTPPPLVCIEEPELGLHPDILPSLAKLLEEASERCQLIFTTHSEVLVDSFTHNPEVVLVAEKYEGETQLERLNAEQLKVWLEEYKSLGNLWSSGHLGGNRW
ncbi:MAG: AAA family ATPase, partial [Deferribacteraceae bacterium]|nr:AAA family ATPase [Deferribacteraceae bacterium]